MRNEQEKTKQLEKKLGDMWESKRYIYENSNLTLEEFEKQYAQIDEIKAKILKFISESNIGCSFEEIVRHVYPIDKSIVQFAIRSLQEEGKLIHNE